MMRNLSTQIFNTVPKHDYLGLVNNHSLKEIACFLDLKKNDISKAFNIPQSSIRYDQKVPKALSKKLQEMAVVCELVAEYFGGDPNKTALWFRMKNPALGDISPRDMIRFGQFEKLLQFVQSSLNGEMP